MKAFSLALSIVFLATSAFAATGKNNQHSSEPGKTVRAPAISHVDDFFLALQKREADLQKMTEAHSDGARAAREEVLKMLKERNFSLVFHDAGAGGGAEDGYRANRHLKANFDYILG